MAIRAIVCNVSTGYFPEAVSPLSIMQSVPSKIAFAMSLASARVGRGLIIIDSNICVAVITGFPALLHFSIKRFCTIGTSSAGISTPKSPLATITPSATFMISSIFFTPSAFSILAIISICALASSNNLRMAIISAARCTKDAAIKSIS